MASLVLREEETPVMRVGHLGVMSAPTPVIATFGTEPIHTAPVRRRPEVEDGDVIAPRVLEEQVPEGVTRTSGGRGGVGVGARNEHGGMTGVVGGTSAP